MRTSNHSLILRIIALSGLLIGLTQIPRSLAQVAQPASVPKARSASAAQAEGRTIPALFVSDIHFDPFHDPAKAQALISAPVTRWQSILSAPPSPNQPQAFDALQQACNARGVDTPFPLLHSSLEAMRSRQPDAKFMTD